MAMEPKKIENMDDLRAAMKDPEVQQAEAQMKKKFLKNNRPKSLALVFIAVVTVFMILAMSSHKASSVIPSAMRTTDNVNVSLDDGTSISLSADQRDAVIGVLSNVKVRRNSTQAKTLGETHFFRFSGEDGEDWWFAVSIDGILYTEKNTYTCTSTEASEIFTQLESLCGAAE